MSVSIQISSNASKVLAQLGGMPAAMQQETAAAMDTQNAQTISHAQQRYLRGPRPEKLGVGIYTDGRKGGRLYRSLTAAPARATANEVISTIGTNVEYARVHEYGGAVTVREHRRRLIAFDRYEKKGRSFVQTQSGIKGRIKAHIRNVPARPYLAPSIADRAAQYGRAISAAILRAWRNLSA